jgi:hypothetical protein
MCFCQQGGATKEEVHYQTTNMGSNLTSKQPTDVICYQCMVHCGTPPFLHPVRSCGLFVGQGTVDRMLLLANINCR